MKNSDNCNNVLCRKINTQSKEKLNKTMVRSVLQCKSVYPKYLSISSNLFGTNMASCNKRRRTGIKPNKCIINNLHFSPWNSLYVVILLLINWTAVHSASTEPSGIQIDPDDGGYTGIVFEIKEEVPEESCAEILKNLKVRFY